MLIVKILVDCAIFAAGFVLGVLFGRKNRKIVEGTVKIVKEARE